MTKSGKWGLFAIAALAAGHMLYAAPAKADPVGDFYKGKRMKMIIRSSPGGGYDTYARLLAWV